MTAQRRPALVAAGLGLAVLVLTPGALAAVDEPPETPPSLGKASLHALQFATNIDVRPVDQGDEFPLGVPRILTLVGWDLVVPGTELRVRLFAGNRLVYEDARTVRTTYDSGFVYNFEPAGGVPEGEYVAELLYNGVSDQRAAFRVSNQADPAPATPSAGGGLSGPVPYADPEDVLVVTREAALRERLGARTDEVLAAAAAVGRVVDLDERGAGETPDTLVPAVRELLVDEGAQYLLIIGNDDVMPFVRVENPVRGEDKSLNGWQLPADWVATDDPYGNLDGDEWDVPEVGVARLPSSEDAELLLTQLGEITPPDGGAFALVNYKRRSITDPILETLDDVVPVEAHYSPPMLVDEIPTTGQASARFIYVLLHGIGVTTDEWSADIESWTPRTADLAGEFALDDTDYATGMDVAAADTAGSVIEIAACYGAWTLDTIQEPQHKTADNSLALDYLRSGARSFVGNTHLSYSYPLGLNGPYVARSGYELAFWQRLMAGDRPIDAFLEAKRRTANTIQELIELDESELAAITLKTLRTMVYFGRP